MHSALSGALVVEKEIMKDGKITKQQFSRYFISEVLIGSKKYYSEIEKICYVVIMSSRKLRHYFEAHAINVLTNQPLNDIISNRDSSSRVSKWAMEMLEYIVDFKKRMVIKSHILADFIAEWREPGSVANDTILEASWLIYCDRA
jgi:hypothetical protein